MDEFTCIRTFIKVVQAGSFSAAARDGSSISSVSRQIKHLETELGVRLLNRNTRRISLTDVGRHFYKRVTAIAYDLDTVTAEVRSRQEDVKGVLRVALRLTVGTTMVIPALPQFMARYPDLQLEVVLSDERCDLIANNLDVAMWLGDIPDADIVARRLTPSQRIVCAAPSYVAKYGVPKTPEELSEHNCLLYSPPSYRDQWSFTRNGVKQDVDLRGTLRSENGLVVMTAGVAGLGLFIVHEWLARNQLAEGKLVQVLKDYTVNPRPGDAELYAVYPSSRGLSRTVRVFVDFLAELFNAERRPGG